MATGLVARASALLQQGDMYSSAQSRWGTYGIRGDASKAQDLSARADPAGIKEAKARLEALRR